MLSNRWTTNRNMTQLAQLARISDIKLVKAIFTNHQQRFFQRNDIVSILTPQCAATALCPLLSSIQHIE